MGFSYHTTIPYQVLQYALRIYHNWLLSTDQGDVNFTLDVHFIVHFNSDNVVLGQDI